MQVLYACHNAPPAIMALDQLIAKFKSSGAISPGNRYRVFEDEIRDAMNGCGWYENLNDHGTFLILNIGKMGLARLGEDIDTKPARAADYSILPDHREPRQSIYYVMHLGKIVETAYSEAEAVAFIEETTGEKFEADDA